MRRYVRELTSLPGVRGSGGKAAGLHALSAFGLAVPKTHVCSSAAQSRYLRARDKNRLLHDLKRELAELVDSTQTYAVRSSSAAEDKISESMAGQYTSVLSVEGLDCIVDAVRQIWESEERESEAYRSILNVKAKKGQMDVLIQEMIPAACAGVSFSRNPVTGADEVIVEAVEGTSQALLRGAVTPHRWVIADRIAASDWPKLPVDVLREVARTTRRVAAVLGYPADLEWAYDGTSLWWLQVRPITTLRGLPVYSNRISREYLPGLVRPLVWSINVPMINGVWVDLFERIVGPLSIDPLSLAKRFHCRAYFNMSGMGALFRKLGLAEDTLEQLSGLVPSAAKSPIGFRWKMLRHLPRLLLFAADIARFRRRVPRWADTMRRRLGAERGRLGEAETTQGLIAWADAFLPFMQEAAYTRIVTVLLHLAVGHLGRRVVYKRGIGDAADLELPDRRLEAYDPQAHLRRLSESLRRLPDDLRRKAGDLSYSSFFRLDGTQALRGDFEAFLEGFGYISESGNDFSTAPWSEDPTAVLRLIAAQGSSGPAAAGKASEGTEDRRTARWARRVTERRVDRERVGAILSRGFHLLRLWALRVGDSLTGAGVLSSASDVFFLEIDELRAVARGEMDSETAAANVARRRSEIEEAKNVTLPDMIVGDYTRGEARVESSPNVLSGIPTSRGIYEGAVCVVRTMDEFAALRDGDVLVVPFSDVAWTPLFARAGAIVAEAGGMLSHSSIVAREFGKPAVVSVPNACALLAGSNVRVNGHEGTVTILDGP
jgi:phosphohistidine swiveling domain-containing protein